MGTLTVLHSFDGSVEGDYPAALIQATDGNFYGTNQSGGANGDDTVYEVTPEGALTLLHTFAGADGSGPFAALIQATDGNFYGTPFSGGTNGDGTVFSLSVGLGPFVETQPTYGSVGKVIKILGTLRTKPECLTKDETCKNVMRRGIHL